MKVDGARATPYISLRDIPLSPRILRLPTVRMLCRARPYEPIEPRSDRFLLRKWAGIQWDAEVIDALFPAGATLDDPGRKDQRKLDLGRWTDLSGGTEPDSFPRRRGRCGLFQHGVVIIGSRVAALTSGPAARSCDFPLTHTTNPAPLGVMAEFLPRPSLRPSARKGNQVTSLLPLPPFSSSGVQTPISSAVGFVSYPAVYHVSLCVNH